MARRATAEATENGAAEFPAPVDPKERQIEITLPASVTREIHAFIGDNPIRRKLAPELIAAVRKTGADAAVAAITGNVQAIFERAING